jgi:hypothetical protein
MQNGSGTGVKLDQVKKTGQENKSIQGLSRSNLNPDMGVSGVSATSQLTPRGKNRAGANQPHLDHRPSRLDVKDRHGSVLNVRDRHGSIQNPRKNSENLKSNADMSV